MVELQAWNEILKLQRKSTITIHKKVKKKQAYLPTQLKVVGLVTTNSFLVIAWPEMMFFRLDCTKTIKRYDELYTPTWLKQNLTYY